MRLDEGGKYELRSTRYLWRILSTLYFALIRGAYPLLARFGMASIAAKR